jgi:hypothetical protein
MNSAFAAAFYYIAMQQYKLFEHGYTPRVLQGNDNNRNVPIIRDLFLE